MLPFFAVILFAVMGIAALTIDAGLAFTTQAQLESTGRTLALEYERFRVEAATNPAVDLADWPDRARELEIALLGPDAQGATWEDWEAAPGVTAGATPLESRFAFAALLPQAVGPDGRLEDGLSVTDLLDARASGEPNATTTTGGLRANGFRPQTELTVRLRPAARVGPPGVAPGWPGVGGRVAITAQAYDPDLPLWRPGFPLELDEDEVRVVATGECVGRTIAPIVGGAALGINEVESMDPGAWTLDQLDPNQVYVPVIDGNCTNTTFRVVAFLNLRRGLNLGASGTTIEASNAPSARNASAVPDAGGAPVPASFSCGANGLLCVPAIVSARTPIDPPRTPTGTGGTP
ncbi:MAG: hypothetical protein AAF430_03600 [Myxococcota bacterium]